MIQNAYQYNDDVNGYRRYKSIDMNIYVNFRDYLSWCSGTASTVNAKAVSSIPIGVG